jgi:uncharacterized membrane protein (Fun14 family)
MQYIYYIKFIGDISVMGVTCVMVVMNIENFGSITATVGGGFFGGILLGYALKKVVKLLAVIVGLFIAGLAYLQYQQLASISWDKVEGSITGLTSAAASILNENTIPTQMMSNFGIPLTSSMASGFTVGFLKG